MQLLWGELKCYEVVYGETGFHHIVGVDPQLPVVSPLELCKVLRLKVHGKHVFKRESECDGIIDRVGDLAPWNFVFYKVFWNEALLFERGKRSTKELWEFAFPEKVSVPKGVFSGDLSAGFYNGIECCELVST